MTAKQKFDPETLIFKLLENHLTVNLHQIATAAGLLKNDQARRKVIQRILSALTARGILESMGTTRARVYMLKTPASTPSFNKMPISEKSKTLLRYLKQPLHIRAPVGYNSGFLESYLPNTTVYLSKADKAGLLALGRSEKTHRPAGTYARHILNRLLIDLSWNSSRLEGNTYSLLETKRLIEQGKSVGGKDAAEAQMILNHKRAIEFVIDSCDEPNITARTIYSIHTLLAFNLLANPKGYGRIRELSVGISGTTYLPLENPHLIKEYFELFVQKLNQIEDPFEQSFFSMIHLSYLQAFEDVNKRTSRLVANIPLIKKNLRPLSFIDVDQEVYVQALLGIYEKNDTNLLKDLYLWAYQQSSRQYTAVQQAMGETNLSKLKYHREIQNIIRRIILENTPAELLVGKIRTLIDLLSLEKSISDDLFKIIEIEIESLHDGNIVGYGIQPAEFEAWQKLQ